MSYKIYYIHLFNDYSGSPRVLCDAINSSLGNKENSYILTSQHLGFLDGSHAKHIKLYYKRVNSKLLQLLFFFIAQLLLFMKLSLLLIKNKIKKQKSIVIVNTMLPFSAAIPAYFFADKLICYIHETKLKPRLFKSFLRFFIEHFASDVFFVSHFLQKEESFKKPNQYVIHNGLRSDFCAPKKLDLIMKHKKKQILFAGSLKGYKGINELVEISRRIPNNVVGALNCEKCELDEFISNQVDLPSNLNLVARPKNLQKLYEESFLVLNLSRPDAWVETFGLSLLEGMAFGCPVIAPPIGGPTEFVNSNNGVLIDSSDYTKITQFIKRINASIEEWLIMSKSATETSSNFTTKNFQDNFRKHLKYIMDDYK